MSDYCLYPNLCGIGVDCSGCLSKEVTRLQSEVERLRGRCGELEDALVWSLGKLSIEVPISGGNISYITAFTKADKALRSASGNAWLLRKQADAMESAVSQSIEHLSECAWPQGGIPYEASLAFEEVEGHAQRLRQQAAESENGAITRKAD